MLNSNKQKAIVYDVYEEMFNSGELTMGTLITQVNLWEKLRRQGVDEIGVHELANAINTLNRRGRVFAPSSIVADRLNKNGIQPRRSKQWGSETIRNMIHQSDEMQKLARNDADGLYQAIIEKAKRERWYKKKSSISENDTKQEEKEKDPAEYFKTIGVYARAFADHVITMLMSQDLIEDDINRLEQENTALKKEVEAARASQKEVVNQASMLKASQLKVIKLPITGGDLFKLIDRQDVEYVAGEVPNLIQTIIIERVDNIEFKA